MSSKTSDDVPSEPPQVIKEGPIIDVALQNGDFEEYRKDFLSQFDAAEDRRIMRKIDFRFLPLMGFMYLFKQIDYTNAATIKVLQVGKSSNILEELDMTANQYNWLSTIYFVSSQCPNLPCQVTDKI